MSYSFDLSIALGVHDLSSYLKLVEERIDKITGDEKSTMNSAIARLTKTRGKRLRPALVIASALAAGGTVEDNVLNACICVELIHIASLIHDDIIDSAGTRRSVPTINSVEGVNTAILAGDYLFAKACYIASLINSDAAEIAANTIMALCKGESYELEHQYDAGRTEPMLMQAITGKTASLIAASCELGAVCAEVQPRKRAAFSRFGQDFGISFQLIDDVLDYISTDKLLGKPVGSDVKSGVYTLPVVQALKSADKDLVYKILDKRVVADEHLVQVLLQNGSIEYTLNKATDFNKTASNQLLSEFGVSVQSLAMLPELYLDWALDNLVARPFRKSVRELRLLR